jgi:tetratricopeptide (TPR) repeat protein
MNQLRNDFTSLLSLTNSYLSENKLFEAQQAWSRFLSDNLLKFTSEFFKTVCDDLLNQLPESFSGYYFRGCAFMSIHQFSYGLSDLIKASEIKPNEPKIIYNIAECQYYLHKYHEALRTCLTLLKLEPNNPGFLYFTAGVMISSAKYENALALLEIAINYDQGNIACFIQKANCLRLMNNFAKAKKTLEKAEQMLEKSPNQEACLETAIDLYFNRGLLKSAMGDFDGSIKDHNIANSIINSPAYLNSN